jgi:flagellar basal body rod protein FlgC
MPNPTRIEINCETGVESIIELTDAEVAELAYQAELAAERRQKKLLRLRLTQLLRLHFSTS